MQIYERLLHIMHRISLSADTAIPVVGLGTWKAQSELMDKAVEVAIKSGYRHFDTAFNYNTEEPLGNALERQIKEGLVKREELFITTKLPVFGNRANDVEHYIKASLSNLKMNYVDLYLMHMPFSFRADKHKQKPEMNADGTVSLDIDSNYVDTWKAMEAQVDAGRTKCIGVSNFNEEQLQNLYSCARIKPAVLQIEMHAYNQQEQLINLCATLKVAITAYAPLGSPSAQKHFKEKYDHIHEVPNLLMDHIVLTIASDFGKTPGQILLRHLIQKGIIVIPKSVNPERIQENIAVFDFALSEDEISILDELDRGEKGRIFDFLFFKGVEEHPDYPFKNK